MLDITLAILLVIAAVGCFVLNVAGMPGNWLTLLIAGLYAFFGPSEGRLDIGWQVIVGLLVLAATGEILEFFAGLLGAKRAGASRRSALLSLAGSIGGGLLGLVVGLPIPVIGSLAAAVLFAAVGALIGGIAGERWKGIDWEGSWRVGYGAFWGRLLGTAGKIACGGVMLATCVVAVLM